MKRRMRTILVAMLSGWMAAGAQETGEKTKVNLIAELSDGSRLIGTTALPALPVHAEMLGRIDVALANIRSVKFIQNQESVAITMTNGDILKGRLGEFALHVETVIGRVTLPVASITSIHFTSTAIRFHAAEDFSSESNPHEPWSYGWRMEGERALHLFPRRITSDAEPWIRGWRDKDGAAAVGCHVGDQIVHLGGTVTIRPGQLWFHPGPRGEQCVIRWTAPRAGRFRIHGAFTGLSGYQGAPSTTTDVHIVHKEEGLYDSWINLNDRPNEAAFQLERDIKMGDTVDFVVGFGNGGHGFDSTGLEAILTLESEAKGE